MIVICYLCCNILYTDILATMKFGENAKLVRFCEPTLIHLLKWSLHWIYCGIFKICQFTNIHWSLVILTWWISVKSVVVSCHFPTQQNHFQIKHLDTYKTIPKLFRNATVGKNMTPLFSPAPTVSSPVPCSLSLDVYRGKGEPSCPKGSELICCSIIPHHIASHLWVATLS